MITHVPNLTKMYSPKTKNGGIMILLPLMDIYGSQIAKLNLNSSK
jgi:hypothetical protein